MVVPAPRKRGRPRKNPITAAPEPKRRRAVAVEATGAEATAAAATAVVGVTRSGRQVRLTKKAAEARGAM